MRLLILRSFCVIGIANFVACTPSPEALRASAAEKEEQRTQLVERLWEDFQAESKMGTLDVAAAQAKARGTKPGDNFAQGVVDNLLHSVKSGFKEAFEIQVKVAGEGKAVNTGIQVADTFFSKDEVRAKCREASQLAAEAEALRKKAQAAEGG